MLNLKDAISLYKMLSPHLPEKLEESAFKFAGKIIDSALEAHEEKVYSDAIILMSGMTLDELKDKTGAETLEIFLKGLIDNDIHGLQTFCRDILGI